MQKLKTDNTCKTKHTTKLDTSTLSYNIMSDADHKFMFTVAAWMIPAVNGSLSAISSLIIMFIIVRLPPQSRTSGYHIIMFIMSFWDAIASVAVALNSTLMPVDVYDIYPFAGKAFGNVRTCATQGFLIWMGTFFVLSSNCALNVYYVCTLRYGMSEERFKKFVLPAILILAMAVSIFVPTAALGGTEYINPHPVANVCLVALSYPLDCTVGGSEDIDNEGREITNETSPENSTNGNASIPQCIRGGGTFESPYILRMLGFILVAVTFLILVISLLMVLVAVFEAELKIRKSQRIRTNIQVQSNEDRNTSLDAITTNEFRRTRAVLFQAMLYISAFLLTWVWLILSAIMTQKGSYDHTALMVLTAFFMPLQGFFNAMIFVYHKVHTLRQASRSSNRLGNVNDNGDDSGIGTNAHSQLSYCAALKQVIRSPSSIPDTLVSRIEIVDEDIMVRRQGDYYRNIPGSPIRRTGRLRSDMMELSPASAYVNANGNGQNISASSIHSNIGMASGLSSSEKNTSSGIMEGDRNDHKNENITPNEGTTQSPDIGNNKPPVITISNSSDFLAHPQNIDVQVPPSFLFPSTDMISDKGCAALSDEERV